MSGCYVILALPGDRRAWLLLPGSEEYVTAAIRAGAQFVGVATIWEEAEEWRM